MIDFLANIVSGMIREHKDFSEREKKLKVEINFVYTLYRLNLMSTEELKKAKLTHIMAMHLEKFNR